MINDSCSGFTLLELLIVLIIIGFLVTATGRAFRKVDKDVQITAALTDMKAIADAIVKGIYPDVGRIPCIGEDPVSAVTYLCLNLKGCMGEIHGYTYENTYQGKAYKCIEYQQLSPKCIQLLFLLAGQRSSDKECGQNGILKSKLTWNKYYAKGYRGPYIEPNATYYYNSGGEGSEEGYYLPAIATPWADKCEKMAKEAEKNMDDDLAKQYREGKYYQILQPKRSCARWDVSPNCDYQCTSYRYEIPKNVACIVCNGPDCLSSSPMQAYPKNCVEACVSYEEKCGKLCDIECGSIEKDANKRQCYERCLPKVYKECINNDACFSECASKLKDPNIDIGDDIVMFVFSGGVRVPLER